MIGGVGPSAANGSTPTPRTTLRRQGATLGEGEKGYALLAAVVAIAVLALMSLRLIDTGRGVALGVRAEAEQARLAAAADAGLAIAVLGLAEPDRARRWSIDGRPRRVRFAGTDLTIIVEDERGKVPINQLAEEQVRALFEALGSAGSELAVQSDSMLDWLDDDDEPRADGAEYEFYAPRGVRPRNGAFRSVEELLLVRGMTPAVLERLRGVAVAYRTNRAGFDERFAAPLAIAIMSGGGVDAPAVISRQRELAGQVVAIDLAEEESLVGRPLTVRVSARRGGGGGFARATVIELTGQATRPYVVRALDAW